MICRTLTADALASDLALTKRLVRDLTRDGSDFQAKLMRWAAGAPAGIEDGTIAVVEEDGDVIGWARTEVWESRWSTLEAFVHLGWRQRGVAALAASALVASWSLPPDAQVAVFRPSMLVLARRVGIHPVLFAKEGDRWVRQ